MEPTIDQIRVAAERCEGIGNKVFVAEVARELGVPLASIADTLLAAHRAHVLPMSRWDLAQAMHETVDQTSIPCMGGEFHVVRLSRDVRQMPKTHGDYGLSYYSRDAARVAPATPAAREPSRRELQEQAYEAWQAACAAHGEDSPEAAAAWRKVTA